MFCKCTWHRLGILSAKSLSYQQKQPPIQRVKSKMVQVELCSPHCPALSTSSLQDRTHPGTPSFFASLILHKYRQNTRQIKYLRVYHRIPISKNSGLPIDKLLLSAGRWKLYVITQATTLVLPRCALQMAHLANCQGYRPLSVSQSLGARCLEVRCLGARCLEVRCQLTACCLGLQTSSEAELLPRAVSSGGRYVQ